MLENHEASGSLVASPTYSSANLGDKKRIGALGRHGRAGRLPLDFKSLKLGENERKSIHAKKRLVVIPNLYSPFMIILP